MLQMRHNRFFNCLDFSGMGRGNFLNTNLHFWRFDNGGYRRTYKEEHINMGTASQAIPYPISKNKK